MSTSHSSGGKVFLVGAGPGDPGLLTLRGRACLESADLVVYDYLANSQLLDYCRPNTERICLGRHGHGRLLSTEEVNSTLIAAARAGRTVVRLKSGDPLIFAHAASELTALSAAGISYEIVPGITAALAAGSYAGVTLTDRDHASAVALVTGREDEAKAGPPLDYAALAKFPGTLVFYMGVTSAPHWTQALIAAGLAPATPAVIVRRCSWPDQQQFACPLGEVAATLAAQRLRPPVIVLVGQSVSTTGMAAWFTGRPLFGQNILVTRPRAQAGSLAAALRDMGAEVLIQPAIEILPPESWEAVDSALQRLAEFRWLVFSSANGVQSLLDRLLAEHGDLRRLGEVNLAAIGPATAAELARYRLKADLTPTEYRAEALAAALAPHVRGQRVLLVRASRGREVLAEQLTAAGAHVQQVVCYRSVDVPALDAAVAEALREGRIDWATVTSSAIARSLARLCGDDLHKLRLASISPVTSATLRELGHEPTVEAADYTTAGLTAALAGFAARQGV